LKDGKVLATGEKLTTLTAKTLSDAFSAKLKLRFKNGRFEMNVFSTKRVVV
jgi:hypothetical protein